MSLTLVLGGTRSGKSAFAERLAGQEGGDRVLYVATALTVEDDPELSRRVADHRDRRPQTWGTLELGGGNFDAVLGAARQWNAVLLDSLTLWASARMLGGGKDQRILAEFGRFVADVEAIGKPVILVSDEVGLGVVPESAEGRRFRDLLGSLNQRAAAAASEVYLCVAGLEMRLK